MMISNVPVQELIPLPGRTDQCRWQITPRQIEFLALRLLDCPSILPIISAGLVPLSLSPHKLPYQDGEIPLSKSRRGSGYKPPAQFLMAVSILLTRDGTQALTDTDHAEAIIHSFIAILIMELAASLPPARITLKLPRPSCNANSTL